MADYDYSHLVLFKDGSFLLFSVKPTNSSNFQKGAHLFQILETTPVYKICSWIARGYPTEYGDIIKKIDW